ncbi:hypothetical protein [Paucibacter sp. M5-1]|uniref:hypothetical protein n=1 Tax=Paucibacter sp. M5-1 TaxID=3015998 RepID=UPI0022B8B3AE|nr:hypothetical protein [Paucibacter sp. M5-1]MCZ7881255.1 hypothetical protein [Paucibacter sp. M5-1]
MVVVLVTLTLTSSAFAQKPRKPLFPKYSVGVPHEQRTPVTREHEKRTELEKAELGVTHVEGFIDDVRADLDQLRLFQTARFEGPLLSGKRELSREPNFARIGVTTSKNPVNGKLLVTFFRLGFLQEGVAEKWVTPPITVFDAYRLAFESQDSHWTPQQVLKGFSSAHLVLDQTLLVKTATTGWILSLELVPQDFSRVSIRWPKSSEERALQHWYSPYKFESDTGEISIFLRIGFQEYPGVGKSQLLGAPPPTTFVKGFERLRASAFSKSDLSIVLLEGEARTKEELFAAAKNGGPSVAMDLTGEAVTNETIAELESRFSLRKGKTIAVIGHYERGEDAFHIRSPLGATIGKIPRTTLLDWGKKYDVSVLLMGCKTTDFKNLTGLASTATNVNSLSVVRALATASNSARTWLDFFASMSSPEMPIVLGVQPSESDFGTASIVKRLPNGRLRTIAEVSYYLRCRLWQSC